MLLLVCIWIQKLSIVLKVLRYSEPSEQSLSARFDQLVPRLRAPIILEVSPLWKDLLVVPETCELLPCSRQGFREVTASQNLTRFRNEAHRHRKQLAGNVSSMQEVDW